MVAIQHDVPVKPDPSTRPDVSLETSTLAPTSWPAGQPDPAWTALLALLARGRSRCYPGEPVSHWNHALQTAALARRAGASPALISAALLHDIGHLDDDIVDTASSLLGQDDQHELRGARRLLVCFGPAVSEPVRLHVQAKRYLVATRPAYARRLSDDSQRSLALQGGPLSPEACARFIALPGAQDALRLRCWDDLAKVAGGPALTLRMFLPALATAWREGAAQRRAHGAA